MLHEDALVFEALAADKTLVGFSPRWQGQQGRIPQPQQGVTLCFSGWDLSPFMDYPVLLQFMGLQEGLAAVYLKLLLYSALVGLLAHPCGCASGE
jgi:hypothetical protein